MKDYFMATKYIFTHKQAQILDSNIPQLPPNQETNVVDVIPPVTQVPVPEPTQQDPEPSNPLTTVFNEWKKYDKVLGYYINVKGVLDNSPLSKNLLSLGYRYNRRFSTYSKAVKADNVEQIESELLGVAQEYNSTLDTDGINKAKAFFAEQVEQEPEISEDDKKAQMTDNITKFLQELATATDEASSNEIIRNFLDFSSKFYNYSPFNQMMIWLQFPKATKISGAKKWQKEFGRILKEYETDENGNVKTDDTGNPIPIKPIDIFAPVTRPIKGYVIQDVLNVINQYISSGIKNSGMSLRDFAQKKVKHPNNLYYLSFVLNKTNSIEGAQHYLQAKLDNIGNKAGYNGDYTPMGNNQFRVVSVYDYSQTDPDPDATVAVYEPPSKDVWQSEHNVEDAEVFKYTQSAIDFAKTKDISINLEEEMGDVGGWSRGAEVAINKMSKGIRQFSTVVHEIAHSLLHFGEDRRENTGKQKEIEAESTAYVVLKHYGITEPSFCANYLALHRAKKEDVLKSMNNVNKAASQIIYGIDKNLAKKAKSYNWYTKVKMASLIRRILIDEQFREIY